MRRGQLALLLLGFVLAACSSSAPAASDAGTSGSGGSGMGAAPATGAVGGSSAGGTSGSGGVAAGAASGAAPGSGGQSGVAGSAGSTAGSGGFTGGTAGSGGFTGGSAGAGAGGAGGDGVHWVGTWATGNQVTESNNLPPAPGLPNNTLRQFVRVSIGGSELRLRLSNEYGSAPVTFNAVHVASPTTGSGIDTSSDRALTFGGSPSVTVPAGEAVTSDTFQYTLPPLSRVAVTIVFGGQSGNVTGHPGSRTTSYLQSGNQVSAASISGAQTDHWYFISGIDVMAGTSSRAIAILGDSITDGRGSTTNGNDRWPDRLAERLQAGDATKHIAVLNLGIGGNTLLSGGLGPTGLQRFDRQVLDQPGVGWVIVLIGINDVNGGASSSALIDGYQQLIDRAESRGLPIYGVPLLPFAGSGYDNPQAQTVVSQVNTWIRTAGNFQAYLPLDQAVSNGGTPPALLPAYDDGDQLHLSPAGYQAMANAIDLGLVSH